MTTHMLKEVSIPYTVNAEDEAIGRDTIVIRRNNQPIAVVLPYAEYEALLLRPAVGSRAIWTLSASARPFNVCCLNY